MRDVSACPDPQAARGIARLAEAGFEIHHQSGSHAQLKLPRKPQLRVTVPRHDRFDLPVPVLRNIIRQAGMTVEEFLEFL